MLVAEGQNLESIKSILVEGASSRKPFSWSSWNKSGSEEDFIETEIGWPSIYGRVSGSLKSHSASEKEQVIA